MCFGWESRVEKSLQTVKLKYTAHVECEKQSDTGNTRGDWNHPKVIHKIPEQRTGKHEIKELHQTAKFGAAHKLRKVLM
jgi:hypothetical protein